MTARCSCLYQRTSQDPCCYFHTKAAAGLVSLTTTTRTAGGGHSFLSGLATTYEGEPDPEQLRFVGVEDPAQPETWLDHWERVNGHGSLDLQPWERLDAESWVPSWETVRR